jgi:hypothetical protein
MSSNMKDSYTALSLDEPDDNTALQSDSEKEESAIVYDNTHRQYRGLIKQLLIILSLSVLFTTAAIAVIVTTRSAKYQTASTMMPSSMPATIPEIFSKPLPDISSLKPKTCGKNSTTARERGCHFDIMSMIWIPHECFDPELTEEFAKEKSWEWSLNENGTDLISEEEIRKGDIQNGWVRFEYHITHCLYTWRKVIKQVERGGAPIDGYVSNRDHMEHCSETLELRSTPTEKWNTLFVVHYPTCYV